jgi:hypothetical protein
MHIAFIALARTREFVNVVIQEGNKETPQPPRNQTVPWRETWVPREARRLAW